VIPAEREAAAHLPGSPIPATTAITDPGYNGGGNRPGYNGGGNRGHPAIKEKSDGG
jgi:hypothetical protein